MRKPILIRSTPSPQRAADGGSQDRTACSVRAQGRLQASTAEHRPDTPHLRHRQQVRNGLSAGERRTRTIGPWRHAVGSVMENVDNLVEPAGRLSQSTTLRGCYVPALVKRSMAWLLCLPVGQALPLALSYRSTLFFFRRGTNGSNPFPSASQPSRAAVESDENLASATLFPGLAHEFRDGAGIKFDGP